jgi:hypothetical protein
MTRLRPIARKLAASFASSICFLSMACFAHAQSGPSPSGAGPLASAYQPAADRLIAASLADDDGYKNLTYPLRPHWQTHLGVRAVDAGHRLGGRDHEG